MHKSLDSIDMSDGCFFHVDERYDNQRDPHENSKESSNNQFSSDRFDTPLVFTTLINRQSVNDI